MNYIILSSMMSSKEEIYGLGRSQSGVSRIRNGCRDCLLCMVLKTRYFRSSWMAIVLSKTEMERWLK